MKRSLCGNFLQRYHIVFTSCQKPGLAFCLLFFLKSGGRENEKNGWGKLKDKFDLETSKKKFDSNMKHWFSYNFSMLIFSPQGWWISCIRGFQSMLYTYVNLFCIYRKIIHEEMRAFIAELNYVFDFLWGGYLCLYVNITISLCMVISRSLYESMSVEI